MNYFLPFSYIILTEVFFPRFAADKLGPTHLIEIVEYEEWWKEKPPVTKFCTHHDMAKMEEVQACIHTFIVLSIEWNSMRL